MIANQERTFVLDGVTITVMPPINRRREIARRIWRALDAQNFSAGVCEQFADITAHTTFVSENGWQPPSPDAGKAELQAKFDEFLDLNAEFTDKWHEEITRETLDPVTAPRAVNRDPNS